MDDALKAKQAAGAAVERKVLEMLLQYEPARELTVGDVKWIASMARSAAFAEFADLCATQN